MFDALKPKPTMTELEEDNARLDAEYTNIQKRVMIKQLKEKGLSKKNFPTWGAIAAWLKSH